MQLLFHALYMDPSSHGHGFSGCAYASVLLSAAQQHCRLWEWPLKHHIAVLLCLQPARHLVSSVTTQCMAASSTVYNCLIFAAYCCCSPNTWACSRTDSANLQAVHAASETVPPVSAHLLVLSAQRPSVVCKTACTANVLQAGRP